MGNYLDDLIAKSSSKSDDDKKAIIKASGYNEDDYADDFMFCLIDNKIDHMIYDTNSFAKCISDDICDMFLDKHILVETTKGKYAKAMYDAYVKDGWFCEKCISWEDFKQLTVAKCSNDNDEYIEKLSGTDIFLLLNLLHKVHKTHLLKSSTENYNSAD